MGILAMMAVFTMYLLFQNASDTSSNQWFYAGAYATLQVMLLTLLAVIIWLMGAIIFVYMHTGKVI